MDSRITDRLQQLSRARSGLTEPFRTDDGSLLVTDTREYIDFYSGAGTLNYGHHNVCLKQALADDVHRHGPLGTGERTEGITNRFFETVDRVLLEPRSWSYRMHLAGPTGAAALEIALQLAREVKGRQNVISFTQGFQGVSGRTLAASAKVFFRAIAGTSAVANTTFMPYDRSFGPDVDTMAYLEQMLDNTSSPQDIPAAVIVETVLGQGGINVLTWRWLKELEMLCQRYDMLLIMDDTQVGCGRTGRFFSFETADIHADMIVLSKSLSGFGLPMSLLLSDPDLGLPQRQSRCVGSDELDCELALLTATHALDRYWTDETFATELQRKEGLVRDWLENIVHSYSGFDFGVRGRGLIQGLVMSRHDGLADQVARKAFESGLLIETSGNNDEVLKLLPALTINERLLIQGLEIIERSLADVLRNQPSQIRSSRPDSDCTD